MLLFWNSNFFIKCHQNFCQENKSSLNIIFLTGKTSSSDSKIHIEHNFAITITSRPFNELFMQHGICIHEYTDAIHDHIQWTFHTILVNSM